ncbi:MAG: hypothetical protein KDA87_10770 [Planctomycetales bacterium]|nr:hypothetical protein [Planctomycetales bacterium]
MGIAILAVLVLLFIVFAYLGARNWQVWHVVLLGGVFIASIGFSMLTALTLRTYSTHRTAYESVKKSLDQELAQIEMIKSARPNDPEHKSIYEVRGDVKRALTDRGRVWRNLRIGELQPNTVILATAGWGELSCAPVADADEFDEEEIEPIPSVDGGEAADGAPAANAVRPLGLETESIVYAFKETPIVQLNAGVQAALFDDPEFASRDTKGNCRVPTFFFGEFKVTAVADDNSSITLQPTVPLDQKQIQELEDDRFTWVLYEVMPVDSHLAFSDLSDEQIQNLFDAQLFADLPAEVRQQMLDEYVRDQDRANGTDPAERKWALVKFLKSYEVDVDVQEAIPDPDRWFDATGRSIAGVLRQEERSKFAKGDEALFDYETALRLKNDGAAEIQEERYFRRLRDYSLAYRTIFHESEKLDMDIADAELDIQKLQVALKGLNQQIAVRSETRDKLTADKTKFDYERTVITQYKDALEAKWQKVRSELSLLYRWNKQFATSTPQARMPGGNRQAQTLPTARQK